jgi:hypothetical protein
MKSKEEWVEIIKLVKEAEVAIRKLSPDKILGMPNNIVRYPAMLKALEWYRQELEKIMKEDLCPLQW